MKIEEFKIAKQELENQKTKNNEKINICDERLRLLEVSSFEYKASTILVYSMLCYFVMFFPLNILFISLKPTLNIIGSLIYPLIVIGGSLGMGTLINHLIYKKYHIKERLKDFSTAKTKIEKFEEQLYYQIELEKANNMNSVINKVINKLSSNESALRELSNKYHINNKISHKNEEELTNSIKNISKFFDKQYAELETLSTQKVLHDQFRSKYQKKINIVLNVGLSGMFTMIFTLFPFMKGFSIISSTSVFMNLVIPFVPFVIGAISYGNYIIKRNKNHEKVLKKFNNKLGEKSLSEQLDKRYEAAYEEDENIKSLIESQTRDLSLALVALMQLKEEQQILQSMNNKKVESKTNDKEKIDDNISYIKEVINVYIQEQFDHDIIFNTENNNHEKGPILVKKKEYK